MSEDPEDTGKSSKQKLGGSQWGRNQQRQVNNNNNSGGEVITVITAIILIVLTVAMDLMYFPTIVEAIAIVENPCRRLSVPI